MKQYFFFILLVWITFSTLSAQQVEYENWDGVFIEIRPYITDLSRFTDDNVIYRSDNKYFFTYQYTDVSGEDFYYNYIDAHTWEFVSVKDILPSTVTGIQITVLPDLKDFSMIPDYNQTVIKYNYTDHEGNTHLFSEKTGLIENEKNIWMHPPRRELFKILEINPFPFIQQPYEKGNKWNWSLEIGGQWGDKRWKEWDEDIENQYVYEIVSTNSLIRTPLGELSCYKIDSHAESKLGKTYLTAYFNEIYGFVRMEYINIDGSTLNIELERIEKATNDTNGHE